MTTPYANEREHDEAVVGWVLHTLDRDDEVAFLVHLEDCPECRRLVAETTAATSAIGAAIEQEEPPAHLRDRILAAVADEPEPPRRPRPEAAEPPRRSRPDAAEPSSESASEPAPDATVVPMSRGTRRARLARRLAVVAAAVAAVVVIGGLVSANRSLQEQRDLQASDEQRSAQVASVLRDAGRPGSVHATLADPAGDLVGMVVDAGSGPRVMTTGLSSNDSDQVYVLWSLADAQPRAVGMFDVSGPSPSVRSVGSEGPAGPVAGFAVSLEPGRTVPSAPTRIVASGQVGR